MQLVVTPSGSLRCLYNEAIELSAFGPVSITRASHVEPDKSGQWFADLALVGGPRLGPFNRRSDALDAEHIWLEANWLTGQD
jgi:hypothetical protein